MDFQNIGKYEILGKLGEGAMGVVFKARDPIINRLVAIKMIASTLDSDDDLRKRFRREAQSAGQLNHPNIITVYDFSEDQGKVFMIMELLEGTDLREIIRVRPNAPLTQKLSIMEQICDGLAFAHGRDVVHRDLKPSNIHVLPNGQVKIMDFGLARLASSDMTRTGLVMGTPQYMSPEQIKGQKADARSDVFSMGAIFYELLSAKKPFAAESMHAVMFKALNDDPEPLERIAPDTPPGILQIVRKALHKDPDKRYQSGAELRDAVRHFRQSSDIGESTVMTASTEMDEPTVFTEGPSLRPQEAPADGPLEPSSRSVPGLRTERSRPPIGTRSASMREMSRPGEGTLRRPDRASYQPAPPPVATRRWLIPAAAGAAAVAGVLVIWLLRSGSTPETTTEPAGSAQLDILTQALVGTQVELAQRTLEDKEYRKALAEAEKAVKLDPNNADAQAIFAKARAAIEELDQAAAQARSALEKGQTEEAARALGRVLALDPSHPAATELQERLNGHFRSQVEESRQRMSEAQRAADALNAKSLQAYTDASRLASEGQAHLKEGQFVAAAQKFLEARDAFERARRSAEEREAARKVEEAARAEVERAAQAWVAARDAARPGAGNETSFQEALARESRARELTGARDFAAAGRAYREAMELLQVARQEALRRQQAVHQRQQQPPTQQPQQRAASTAPPRDATPPTSVPSVSPPSSTAAPVAAPRTEPTAADPVVNDEAAIRQLLASYQRAIESKDMALYKRIQPTLTGAEEHQLTTSFQMIDAHQVEFSNLKMDIRGETATLSLTRRDTFVVKGKAQKPVTNSQTMVLAKGPQGWTIRESR
jgi:serine/threonine-protein kinase